MGRTLFWYIFKDLLKIFFLASGAVAGIMSFGGLLRPLTENGLGAGQVVKMLGYFMPAMQTYSLPVAALFATTMVYGRLSADNEITACRAAGISMGPFGVAFPAVVLGVGVMIASFIFLFFIVPVFTLKVEKVIYSNLAQLVQNQIERTHRIEMKPGNGKEMTIFAQEAHIVDAPPDRPHDQVVELVSPVFVTYEPGEKERDGKARTTGAPEDFYMAKKARAYITQDDESGEVYMTAKLEGGMKFPRRYRGGDQAAMQISFDQTGFYSDPMESPVRENTKFMPLAKLNELLAHPEKSRRLMRPLNEFIRDDQRQAYLKEIQTALASSAGACSIVGGGESYLLRRGDAPMTLKPDRLIIGYLKPTTNPSTNPSSSSSTQPSDADSFDDDATTLPSTPPMRTLPRFVQTNSSQGLDITAHEVSIRVTPTIASNPDGSVVHLLVVDVELSDATVQAGQSVSQRSKFSRPVTVAMPPSIAAMENTPLKEYLNTPGGNDADRRMRLRRDEIKLTNSLISEAYSRASFSVSCLILVLVGAALGMMFKSGNFLSAFALSVVPAGLCILLIITGQHTCENVPLDIRHFNNPLTFGLSMIWAGNVVVAVLAVVLLGKLRSQ